MSGLIVFLIIVAVLVVVVVSSRFLENTNSDKEIAKGVVPAIKDETVKVRKVTPKKKVVKRAPKKVAKKTVKKTTRKKKSNK